MDKTLDNFLTNFNFYSDIENAKKEQDSFQTHPYRGGEKLPKFYDYKTFIDSDGSKINVDDIKEKISVDYNNIMFSNFQGWSLDCESNQFPLFSTMFTTAKNTYQIYNKKRLWSLTKYDKTTMVERSSKPGKFDFKECDIIVCRGGAARQANNYRFKGKNPLIITLQSLWEVGLPGVVFDNKYLVKAPSAYLSSTFIKNIEKIKRENFIMFASTVDDMNNQRSFAKLIDPDVVKDYTILFCGNIGSRLYQKEVTKILDDKGIKHIFLGLVPHYIISYLYLISKTLVRYATTDYGPRCISEGLWAGLPFITNGNIIMPDEFMEFGTSCENNNTEELNSAMENNLLFDSHIDIHNFCKENITLKKTYSKFINDINKEYRKSL